MGGNKEGPPLVSPNKGWGYDNSAGVRCAACGSLMSHVCCGTMQTYV